MKDFKLLVESWSQYIDEADATSRIQDLPEDKEKEVSVSDMVLGIRDILKKTAPTFGPAERAKIFDLIKTLLISASQSGDMFMSPDIKRALKNINDFTRGMELSEEKKEKIVKGMKSSKKDFKKRYGKDAEAVMYATATKLAKK